jgi:hypothetical protein
MTTYARIQGNMAVEVFVPPTGFTLDQCFHPEIAALFTEVPDGTEVGATTADGGETWTNPAVQPAPEPAPTVYELLTPMQFYLSFKTNERMLLKALALTGVPIGSPLVSPAPTADIPVDPIIAECWATYQMTVSANASVDPNLDSIQEMLGYLANPAAPSPPVIVAARIPQILAGIAQ